MGFRSDAATTPAVAIMAVDNRSKAVQFDIAIHRHETTETTDVLGVSLQLEIARADYKRFFPGQLHLTLGPFKRQGHICAMEEPMVLAHVNAIEAVEEGDRLVHRAP